MTQFKYNLRPGSKKETCPNCNKKTFVPYIENETGNEIPTAGRCDREQNCGFHKKPEHNEQISKLHVQVIEKKTDYISLEVLESHFCNDLKDNFTNFLKSKFEFQRVFKTTTDYFLSSKNNQVIFWQIDQLERIRSGKVMDYSPITGKRIKDSEGKSSINWMHKQPYNLKQCLFGLHLIKKHPTKAIGIVESEKTAVIMSIVEPKIIWMACGSLNGFKIEYLAPIKLRKIIGFPDKGCFDKWQETATLLNEMGFQITISDVLELHEKANIGDDLADLYV